MEALSQLRFLSLCQVDKEPAHLAINITRNPGHFFEDQARGLNILGRDSMTELSSVLKLKFI